MKQKQVCPQCSEADDEHIFVHSGINLKREPFIHIANGRDARIQLSPEEARMHGLSIIEAAEAAESDVIFYRMLIDKIGLKMEQAASVVAELRNMREYRIRGEK